MRHLVLSRRDPVYPFPAYWCCTCGVKFTAPYMGSPLYKEFNKHLEEVMEDGQHLQDVRSGNQDRDLPR